MIWVIWTFGFSATNIKLNRESWGVLKRLLHCFKVPLSVSAPGSATGSTVHLPSPRRGVPGYHRSTSGSAVAAARVWKRLSPPATNSTRMMAVTVPVPSAVTGLAIVRNGWQIPQGGPGREPGVAERGHPEGPERTRRGWHDADAVGRLSRQPGGAAAHRSQRVGGAKTTFWSATQQWECRLTC